MATNLNDGLAVVRVNSAGIAYGDPIPAEDLRWEVGEEIFEARQSGETCGEVEVGGQRYRWRPESHRYTLFAGEWLGTPDGSAPEGYSIFPYYDLAWESLGHTGDCPAYFADEATARKVAGAIREDEYGVMPSVTVREARD